MAENKTKATEASVAAHLAAIAIEHNAEVLTFDRDFARFTGLRYQLLS